MNVSNPINIFNPGCNDKFVLTKGKELYEFSYKTEIYLACKISFNFLFYIRQGRLRIYKDHNNNSAICDSQWNL